MLTSLAPQNGHASSDDATVRAAHTLDTLIHRASAWPLSEPGPSQSQLDSILDTALRAPDHGRLRPWRFVVVRGPAREAFGDLLVTASHVRDPGSDRSAHTHRRQRAFAAPVIIALGAAISPISKVPKVEQLLAVGAATMNMLNAAHALGLGAFWVTGPDTYDATIQSGLGLSPTDALVGFLLIGTPPAEADAEKPIRPLREDHVREWSSVD